MKALYLLLGLEFFLFGLNAQDLKDSIYHAKLSAPGTQMIPVYDGKYRVFTQRIGNGNTHLLLLHGGPGNTHEYFENFPDSLRKLGVTIYFYDQLGSYFSDTPDDSTIWNIDRFVEEVEEVRVGLGLDSFYLLGHSWGGMLAELYAARYGQHLKGLILSNVPGNLTSDTTYLPSVIDSIDKVVRYRATLLPKFEGNRAEIDSIYQGLTLYDTAVHRVLAKKYNHANDSLFGRTMLYHKAGKMPDPLRRNMKHARFESIEKYHFNSLGADYAEALKQIETPTLLISAKNDFLNPERYEDLKSMMKNAQVRVYLCPDGAHFPMWDDSENYFRELRRFIGEVNNGSFNPDE